MKVNRRNFVKRSLALPLVAAVAGKTFGEQFPSGFTVFSQADDKESLKRLLEDKATPVIWLFTGDSITHGAAHTHGYRSYPEVFAERIRWELRRVRDVIINTGISGHTTKLILDDFDWRVTQFRPKVVSMMIGTNDCSKDRVPIEKFEENLKTLVAKFRGLGAIPILHTPNIIITEKDPTRARLPEYVEVTRRVAFSEGVILIDNYKYWMETNQQGNVKVYRDWLNDPLHPDGDGHVEIARLMFRELGIFDPKAATCGGPFYEGYHEQ